jgi:hypothetical protein
MALMAAPVEWRHVRLFLLPHLVVEPEASQSQCQHYDRGTSDTEPEQRVRKTAVHGIRKAYVG